MGVVITNVYVHSSFSTIVMNLIKTTELGDTVNLRLNGQ